jgi:hypothetical protein
MMITSFEFILKIMIIQFLLFLSNLLKGKPASKYYSEAGFWGIVEMMHILYNITCILLVRKFFIRFPQPQPAAWHLYSAHQLKPLKFYQHLLPHLQFPEEDLLFPHSQAALRMF